MHTQENLCFPLFLYSERKREFEQELVTISKLYKMKFYEIF